MRLVFMALSGEIVLGQPDVAEAQLLGKTDLFDLVVDADRVLFRRWRHAERQPAELHW
jgi:hypothetical protein